MGKEYISRYDPNDGRERRFVLKKDLGEHTGDIISWNDGKLAFLFKYKDAVRTWETVLEDGTARYLKEYGERLESVVSCK
jgi:hypothetical protein